MVLLAFRSMPLERRFRNTGFFDGVRENGDIPSDVVLRILDGPQGRVHIVAGGVSDRRLMPAPNSFADAVWSMRAIWLPITACRQSNWKIHRPRPPQCESQMRQVRLKWHC